MIRVVNKIGFFMAGNQKDLVIENKIFNIVAFLSAATCFISLVSNLFIGEFPLAFNIILLVCAIIFAVFFYLSAFKKMIRLFEIPLQVVAISLLAIVWFNSQGVEGSGTFYFFLVTFAFIYSNSHGRYWLVLLIYLLLAVILVFFEYFSPDLIRHYPDRDNQLIDLSVNMVVSLAILGFTAILLKQNYDKERLKVEQHADELKNLNATKDKFFSIISHDLRNPFGNLLGLSRQLHTNLDNYSQEEIKERIKLIEQSSRRGYELLENLLEWSMTQTSGIKYDPVQIDLHSVINECLMVLEGQIESKKIHLKVHVGNNFKVRADFNMLKVIIRNLLTNAVKYSKPGGKITLEARMSDERMAEISLSDEGVGIPQDEIEKLFRIDTKYSTQGTAEEYGTGLGLILCKEFVEKHSGRIWVESKLNSGSTFRFTLPV